MGICCHSNSEDENPNVKGQNMNSQSTLTNTQENTILPNQLTPTPNNIGNNNIQQTQNNTTGTNKNAFPKGTKYEKELNSNFKFYDVVWYDPNKINDFDNYRECFSFVRSGSIYDLETAKSIFMNELLSKFIVITPGFKGEELIENLKDFECIRAFFIFCRNEKFEESWPQKFKKLYALHLILKYYVKN